VDDTEVLGAVVHASICAENPVFGAGQLCARRDRVPDPVVGVGRVGECRELHQVVQLGDAFGRGHQIALSLLLHAVAGLFSLPNSSFLTLTVMHRVSHHLLPGAFQ
jgi:hypothetical protein